MLFSTHTTLALLAVIASAVAVTAVPHRCPPGAAVTVTVTVHETTTVSVGMPASSPSHHSSSPPFLHSTSSTSTPTPPSTPTPMPTSTPPSSGTPHGSDGSSGNNNGSGSGTGNRGSGGKMDLCCNYKGQADSLGISLIATLLGIDLSGDAGLIGVMCGVIGEGSLASDCSGSILQCGSLSDVFGLQVGSDCSV